MLFQVRSRLAGVIATKWCLPPVAARQPDKIPRRKANDSPDRRRGDRVLRIVLPVNRLAGAKSPSLEVTTGDDRIEETVLVEAGDGHVCLDQTRRADLSEPRVEGAVALVRHVERFSTPI